MEEKINIAKILKDKPEKTILYDTMRDINVSLYVVEKRNGETNIRCSRFDICWIVSLIPCNSNDYYNGKIQVRVNIPKKDGTRSNREYLIYSWEVDSIKKID